MVRQDLGYPLLVVLVVPFSKKVISPIRGTTVLGLKPLVIQIETRKMHLSPYHDRPQVFGEVSELRKLHAPASAALTRDHQCLQNKDKL
jgi:hypothetical protein